MKPLRKIASELIGFDRRERRATYVVAIILIILIIIRISTSGSDDIVLTSEGDLRDEVEAEAEVKVKNQAFFNFDPNTVSPEDLIKLGLTERQMTTFINYRRSGAKFYDTDDIAKVYGLDSSLVANLKPWIIISERKQQKYLESTKAKDPLAAVSSETHPVYLPAVIDLNRCSAGDLEKLPGIGPVLSERIMKYRNLLGGFINTGQLREVYGIDSATYKQIFSLVTVRSDSVIKVNLDSCSFTQMARHPYFGQETARAIIKFRALMGAPVTVETLVSQRVITAAQAERIIPYIGVMERQSGHGE